METYRPMLSSVQAELSRRPNSDDIQIGRAIRFAREASGRSQQDIADLFGISHQQISKYESGKSSMPVWMLVKIATFLQILPHHLLQSALAAPGFSDTQKAFDGDRPIAEFEAALRTVTTLWPKVKGRS